MTRRRHIYNRLLRNCITMTCCSSNKSKTCCNSSRNTKITAIVLLIAALGAGAYYWTSQADAETSKTPAVAAPAAADAKGPALNKAIKDGAIYATVNGENITGKDVNAVVKTLPPQISGCPGRASVADVGQSIGQRQTGRCRSRQSQFGRRCASQTTSGRRAKTIDARTFC